MRRTLEDLRGKVRIALDEIAGENLDSEFTDAFDSEVNQALLDAATELSEELPNEYLMPRTLTEFDGQTGFDPIFDEGGEDDPTVVIYRHIAHTNGTGSLYIPNDFLRLVAFRLISWNQNVVELTDPASNLGRMQVCEWTRGTPQKPVAMLLESWGEESLMYRELRYYTAGKADAGQSGDLIVNGLDHRVWRFSYIQMPRIADALTTPKLAAGLTDRAEPLVIYRACAILLEGKQNNALADRFRAMSTIGVNK